MPATFDRNLGVYVRKPQLTQVFDAWEGVANGGVPLNLVSVSSDTVPAATIRNLGNGGALKVLNKAGLPLFVVDETGISTISFGGGTVSSPSITMGTDPDTGWYKPDFDRIGMALGGVKKFDFRAGHMEFVDQLEVNLGAIVADKQALFTTAQWNNVAVTFTHNKLNIIDTTSAAASLITDWQVNGISQFSVRKDGLGTFRGGLNIATGVIQIQDATTARISSTAAALRLNTGTGDLIFERAGGQVGRFRASDNFFSVDIGLAVLAGGITISRTAGSAHLVLSDTTNVKNWTIQQQNDILQFINNAGTVAIQVTNLGTLQFGALSDTNLYRAAAGALRTDGNFGIGVTPSAWGSNFPALQIGQAVALWGDTAGTNARLTSNTYNDGTNQRALITGLAANLSLGLGEFSISTAPSVIAGSIQTFTERLRLNAAGNLGLGATPSANYGTSKALQLGTYASLMVSSGDSTMLANNSTWDGTNWKSLNTIRGGIRAVMFDRTLSIGMAPATTNAGDIQTFTDYLLLSSAGELGLPTGRIYGGPSTSSIRIDSYTLANNTSHRLITGVPDFAGIAFIIDQSNATVAIYAIRGLGANATAEMSDTTASFSPTLTTPAQTNIGWNTTEFQLENKTGATHTYHVIAVTNS